MALTADYPDSARQNAAPGEPSSPSRTRPLRVLITHPARQHSYETVLAAQDAGLLADYITGYYWGGDASPVAAALRFLPTYWRRRALRTLAKRHHPSIDPKRVTSLPAFHMLARAAGKLPTGRVLLRDGTADDLFDRAVARRLLYGPVPSIVHGFEGGALHTLRAARSRGVITVLDVPSAHEYFVRVNREEGARYDADWTVRAAARTRAEREAADWMFVGSPWARDRVLECGADGRRLVVLPYGADTERFRPRSPAEIGAAMPDRDRPFRVLFVGRLDGRKGIRYLLDAWRSVDLPDAELLLVGPADDVGRRLLSEPIPGCRWLGNVPWYTVQEAFHSADAFVFPSLAEGSALVTYEAMAAGLPVVATPCAGSVVQDGRSGLLIPPRDVAAIVDRIRWLYQHPRDRAALGAQARIDICQRYTWHHYRARIVTAYRAMARGGEVAGSLAELEAHWERHPLEPVAHTATT